MNPEKTPGLTVQTLMALRQEGDALRVITDRLRVKEMGPADHIRTKHEVKAFVEAGDLTMAETLLTKAQIRRESNQSESFTEKLRQRRGQRLGQ